MTAYEAFVAADAAWLSVLVTAYGKDACNARYDERGRGGSNPIREAYTGFCRAREVWEASLPVTEPTGQNTIIAA